MFVRIQNLLFFSVFLLSFMVFSAVSITAHAALDDRFFMESGKLSLSVDGAGTHLTDTYTVDVSKPSAGATVRQAFLLATSTYGPISNGDVTIDGVPVNWDASVHNVTMALDAYSYRSDVTAIVQSTLDAAGAGITSFTIWERWTIDIEGTVLAVVFDDPAQTRDTTVVLFFGALQPMGDNFVISHRIDPTETGALADFGLGISFGLQPALPKQDSIVDVNGTRLTSSAGGYDDGTNSDGGLITVGGLGDSNSNPVNPSSSSTDSFSDDELYTLLPFITPGSDEITVTVQNPSGDDNVFFAYFYLSGPAAVGEGILLEPVEATLDIGQQHTVTATVMDDSGQPVVNKIVNFDVIGGPNIGFFTTVLTDNQGKAVISYTGSGGVGTDSIVANYSGATGVVYSNVVLVHWQQHSFSLAAPMASPVTLGMLFLGIMALTANLIRRGV